MPVEGGQLFRACAGLVELFMLFMSDPKSLAPVRLAFTRKSETESICTSCFNTVRADRYVPLDEAEDIHSDVCLSFTSNAGFNW